MSTCDSVYTLKHHCTYFVHCTYLYYQNVTQKVNRLVLNKGYLRHMRANIGCLNSRLTVKILRFWRLAVKFLVIWSFIYDWPHWENARGRYWRWGLGRREREASDELPFYPGVLLVVHVTHMRHTFLVPRSSELNANCDLNIWKSYICTAENTF